MIDPTPYPELNQVLTELVAMARDVLADNFVGAYLQGSFATGGFDRHSDCDFIVVIERDLTQDELRRLRPAYQGVHGLDYEWANHLEGSFFPASTLRDYNRAGRRIWYADHGHRELERSAHDNTAVIRWILREKGVVLAGPPPADLIDPIPVRALRAEMLKIFTEWGEQILADPREIGSRFYQTFSVLSYCRFLNNLHEGRIGSKPAGAEWAKANLDPAWHGLIDRAWDGRPDPATSVRTPADPQDLERTRAFIEEILDRADALAQELKLV